MGKRRVLTARGPRAGFDSGRLVVPRELRASRGRLYYCEGGLGTPLVLIHGLGASSRWWFPLFPELSSANLRLLAPDLPGFGRSAGPIQTIPDAAKAVVDLVEHLGVANFSLCGHSMGGAIAAQIAADYRARVRRLILIDSAGVPGVGPRQLMPRLIQPWTWCPLGFYSTLLGDALKAGPRTLLDGVRFLRRYDVRPVLQRVRAPTLVIWGERDTLTPPKHGREIAAGLAQARLEVVPRARHLPMISQPETVSRLIVDFLKQEPAAGRGAAVEDLAP